MSHGLFYLYIITRLIPRNSKPIIIISNNSIYMARVFKRYMIIIIVLCVYIQGETLLTLSDPGYFRQLTIRGGGEL